MQITPSAALFEALSAITQNPQARQAPQPAKSPVEQPNATDAARNRPTPAQPHLGRQVDITV
jgi:hypothetical protein